MIIGLTISEEKIIPKEFGIFGMDSYSVGIPGFRRPNFRGTPSEFRSVEYLTSRNSVLRTKINVSESLYLDPEGMGGRRAG